MKATYDPAAGRDQGHGAEPLADPRERQRWLASLGIVLGLHAIPALVAAYWLGPATSRPAPEPAIFIDMAPPAAPPVPPTERPPGPKQVKADTAKPVVQRETIKTPPVPNPAVAVPARPPELPVEARTPAQETTAPPARPAPPAPMSSSGVPNWQGLVLGALDKVKRYPASAQLRRQQGVPWIRFVMDRAGRVQSSRLERSSGFAALDNEAVNLPRRAQPLPKPPADVTGETIELVVPVEFFIK
ncbi:TonB family protein [Sandaracinobacter sp. RS1-74]|uniref:energy transducer TonB family protein n=1 Tax=Sandaracinobacteroides sayramensis TaxID=2913411 RepID=UPI001EDAA3DE|nr:TonB family protein [Sandaracinobacteroides sayramensis]